MADADTRDKRASVIGVGLPAPRLLPHPVSVDAGDFEILMLMYAGVQASGPGQPTWMRFAGTRHMGRGQQFGRSW